MSARLSKIFDWERLAREARFEPAAMAALCPISLRQLERFFEKEFNQTPSTWVRELKCRNARRLIALGWSNKAVAAELHFADESHFCHEFKRVYGSSPQAFAPVYPAGPRKRPGRKVGARVPLQSARLP
jgi:AraC-like DNA-binding protein